MKPFDRTAYTLGVFVNAKCGIYLIENSDGEVYIGQSRDLEARIRKHKKGQNQSGELKYSFFKHGRKNHKYYLLLELPTHTDLETLLYFESLYIKQYRKDGYGVLNCNKGGTGGHNFGRRLGGVAPKDFNINPRKSAFV